MNLVRNKENSNEDLRNINPSIWKGMMDNILTKKEREKTVFLQVAAEKSNGLHQLSF